MKDETVSNDGNNDGFIGLHVGGTGRRNGIHTVKSENANSNVFYSLNGQKVTEPRKGIYIVNGEKRILE